MNNNHILKLIIKAAKLDLPNVLKAFKMMDKHITQEDVHDALRDEHDPKFVLLSNAGLELFLNGFIIFNRGPNPSRKKPQSTPQLTNNIILRKLKIAFDLKDDDLIEIFAKDETSISKYQLSAFFRREGHANYRSCSDALLRSFLYGYAKSHQAL